MLAFVLPFESLNLAKHTHVLWYYSVLIIILKKYFSRILSRKYIGYRTELQACESFVIVVETIVAVD